MILTSSKSDLQLDDRQAVFYLYLGHMQQNAQSGEAAMEFANVQSPKEIVMINSPPKDERS